ncbi:hypothetical protein ACQ4PT_012292 [Festuca glaucescens]
MSSTARGRSRGWALRSLGEGIFSPPVGFRSMATDSVDARPQPTTSLPSSFLRILSISLNWKRMICRAVHISLKHNGILEVTPKLSMLRFNLDRLIIAGMGQSEFVPAALVVMLYCHATFIVYLRSQSAGFASPMHLMESLLVMEQLESLEARSVVVLQPLAQRRCSDALWHASLKRQAQLFYYNYSIMSVSSFRVRHGGESGSGTRDGAHLCSAAIRVVARVFAVVTCDMPRRVQINIFRPQFIHVHSSTNTIGTVHHGFICSLALYLAREKKRGKAVDAVANFACKMEYDVAELIWAVFLLVYAVIGRGFEGAQPGMLSFSISLWLLDIFSFLQSNARLF